MSTLPAYVVFGEALTDFIRQSDGRWAAQPGGACWNVACVGVRLGVAAGYAGSVSNDLFGDALYMLAAEAGLDMRFTQRFDAPPLLAMVPSTQPPEYFFIGEGSADLRFDPDRLPVGWRSAAQILHFGCISLAREPLASKLVEVALAAHLAGKRIAFDPNWRNLMTHAAYRDTFHVMAGIADYLKVSDEDLQHLFPGINQREAIAHLRALAPFAQIMVTRGAAGMSLFCDGIEYMQPAFPVTVADTVGCGDAAMGGWMASLLRQPDAAPATHLRFAAATAALVATRTGAYAPCWEEVSSLLAQQITETPHAQ